MELTIFVITGIVALVSAVLVIAQRDPIRSVIFLIVTLCAQAVLYLVLSAPFVAALQVIVYAGAIMVLFLFVVMLLNLGRDQFGKDPRRWQKRVGILFGLILVLQFGLILRKGLFGRPVRAHPVLSTDYGSVAHVGKSLFTDYLYPFEITSVLLLVAIVGTVILAKKKLEET